MDICYLHLLGQRVQGRGVDLTPDVDVDRRRVPGGGRHHGDALPHPRLPLDVRHTGHLMSDYLTPGITATCHQDVSSVLDVTPCLLAA